MGSMIHRLQRIVQEVNRASDINSALLLITESLTRDLSVEACTIFLTQKDEPDTLVLQAASGLNPEIIGTVRRKLGQGLVGTIAARAEAMNLVDAPAHPKFMHVPDSGETDFPIMLGVPIMAHREVLGVIAVQRSEHVFNEDEEAFLTTLAAQLATSIERVGQGRLPGAVQ